MTARAPWSAAGEFAASRHGVLTRRQAADNGIGKHALERLLRDGALVEQVPGVLVVAGSPPTWKQRLYVATLQSNAVGASATRSSAGLHCLDGYGPGPIEVVFPGSRRQHLHDVVVRRGPMGPEHARDFTEIDSIRCTGVARTLCDLGSVDPLDRVRVAFESARRRGYSLMWMRQTAERLHRPGQRGTGVLLKLIETSSDVPTESALEVRVEQALRGIPGLVRQFTVTDRHGGFIARVDFAIPELKIAIEAHSRQFHFGTDVEAHDAAREAALQAEGWIVRFVTAAQARNLKAVRRSVVDLIVARKLPK